MRQGSIPKVVFPGVNALLGVCNCAESITAERSSQAPSTVMTKTRSVYVKSLLTKKGAIG